MSIYKNNRIAIKMIHYPRFMHHNDNIGKQHRA